MRTFLAKRHHQIALIVLLSALSICSFLIRFYNSTALDIYSVSLVYIALAYGLFVLLLAIRIIELRKHKTATRIPLLKTALSLVLASCLLMTLENISQHRLLYNSATLLAYAVLLVIVISYVGHKMPVASELVAHKQRQFYLWYGIFLLLLFLVSVSMEQSDPYGPHFQLRIVFWILFIQMIVSWMMQLWKINKQ